MRLLLITTALLLGCPTEAPDDDDSADPGDDDDDSDDDDSADDDDSTPWPESQGALASTNSVGRSGAWFLPERSGPIPLAVLFHPTGGDGQGFLTGFVEAARAGGFGLVAPDSRVSPGGDFTWEVGTDPGEVTPDLPFAQTCLEEVLAMDGVVLDSAHVLAAGHSGGASFAPYLASNDGRFTHFGVLHGGVFVGGLGAGLPAAWLSTGADDDARPPAELEGYRDQLLALGFDVQLRIYPGGHGISDDERAELLSWWLQ